MRFLSARQAVEIALHTVSAVLLHLLGNMAVDVKCESGCCMSDVGLYGFDIIAILERNHRIGVPHVVEADRW